MSAIIKRIKRKKESEQTELASGTYLRFFDVIEKNIIANKKL